MVPPIHRWRVGLVCLGVVVLVWVASGFLIKTMSTQWSKPYFITYVTTGTFVVYLFPTFVRRAKSPFPASLLTSATSISGPLEPDSITNTNGVADATKITQFSVSQTAILGCQFGILWFASNLLNNASYVYTSVSTATILACTSSFFTLIIGSFFGVEVFTLRKLAVLCISIVGVGLITHSVGNGVSKTSEEDIDSPDTFFGNMLALSSAALYGMYSTLLKVKVGSESNIDSKMFLGFIGLFNILALWPTLIVLDYYGIETFALPTSPTVWTLLIINALITLIGDLCWVMAMLMTSPLVVTVGLGATIPLSMLGELILSKSAAGLVYCVGAALVCWSFIAINQEEEEQEIIQ